MLGTLAFLSAFCISVFSNSDSASAQTQRIAKNRIDSNRKFVVVLTHLPFLLSDGTQQENNRLEDKQNAERERRLKSLAKGIESENRLERPSVAKRKRTGNSVTFDDIKFEMKKGDRFSRKMLTESINDLVGRRIQLKGFIRPSIQQKELNQVHFRPRRQRVLFWPRGRPLRLCPGHLG